MITSVLAKICLLVTGLFFFSCSFDSEPTEPSLDSSHSPSEDTPGDTDVTTQYQATFANDWMNRNYQFAIKFEKVSTNLKAIKFRFTFKEGVGPGTTNFTLWVSNAEGTHLHFMKKKDIDKNKWYHIKYSQNFEKKTSTLFLLSEDQKPLVTLSPIPQFIIEDAHPDSRLLALDVIPIPYSPEIQSNTRIIMDDIVIY